jgi:diaminohydroxyphosphoribosylaminopyrimidine deaminase/5-amino-6-(5-phosphoribosylamino)uracil reductase
MVEGRGVRALRAAGLEVTTGVLAPDCRAINEAYNRYITTGLPFVTLKLATSLDGSASSGNEDQPRAVVFTTRAADSVKVASARAIGIDVEMVRKSRGGVDLERVLAELGAREVTSLLVEGGGTVAASLVKAGLVDRLVLFMAPVLIGGDGYPSLASVGIRSISELKRLKSITTRKIGSDILIEGVF